MIINLIMSYIFFIILLLVNSAVRRVRREEVVEVFLVDGIIIKWMRTAGKLWRLSFCGKVLFPEYHKRLKNGEEFVSN